MVDFMPSIAKYITWHDQEQSYSCGPASIKMALSVLGISKDESCISQDAGLTCDGLPHRNIVRYIQSQGLYPIAFSEADISQVRSLVGLGFPVIVNYNHIPKKNPRSDVGGHYAVVSSIDQDRIVLADPVEGPDHAMSIDEFVANWFDEGADGKRWFCAVSKVPLELLIEYASKKDMERKYRPTL